MRSTDNFLFSRNNISSNVAVYSLGSRGVAGSWLPEKLPSVTETTTQQQLQQIPCNIHVRKRA